jgi:hypothetical protein
MIVSVAVVGIGRVDSFSLEPLSRWREWPLDRLILRYQTPLAIVRARVSLLERDDGLVAPGER